MLHDLPSPQIRSLYADSLARSEANLIVNVRMMLPLLQLRQIVIERRGVVLNLKATVKDKFYGLLWNGQERLFGKMNYHFPKAPVVGTLGEQVFHVLILLYQINRSTVSE